MRLNWGELMYWNLDMFIKIMGSHVQIALWLHGLNGFHVLGWGDTPSCQPVELKQPYNNLYLEQGSDPTSEPELMVQYDI